MKKFLSKLFTNTLTELERSVFQKRLVEGTLFGVGSMLVASTLLAPKQPKQAMVYQLLTGGAMSLSALGWSKSRKQLEDRYSTFLTLNTEHDKHSVKHAFANEMDLTTVAYETDFAGQINQLAPGAQMRYLKKFDLGGLVIPPNFKQENKLVNASTPGVIPQLQSIQEDEELEYDTSWIDSKFIVASKVVVGAKGSGKSTYLRYEAARWLKENPEGTLVIFDPHYDVDDPSKAWLKDLNQKDIYRVYIFKTTEDIKKYFLKSFAELKDRTTNGLKGRKPYKCIFDEIENLKIHFDDGTFSLFLDFINMSQNEGRKFLFDITLGMHSLKKENTGIDSETLSQMEWLLAEKACYSNTTKYPADFDAKQIRNAAKQLGAIVDKTKCKVVVVIKQEESEPLIIALPYLEPPRIYLDGDQPYEPDEFDTVEDSEQIEEAIEGEQPQNEDYNEPEDTTNIKTVPDIAKLFKKVKGWFQEYTEKVGVSPTPDQVRLAWETATGKKLSEAALVYLIDKLREDE